MKKNNFQSGKIMNDGAKKGFINAIYASGSFALAHFGFLFLMDISSIRWISLFWSLVADLVLFFGAAVISSPVGLLGGIFLTNVLYKDFIDGGLSIKSAIFKGKVTGAVVSLILCVFATIVFFRRGSEVALIYYYLSAVTLGSIFAGRTARQIANEILAGNSTLQKT